MLKSSFARTMQSENNLNIVLTGGNSGIGYQTAKALCSMGHNVVFGCRTLHRNQQCVKEIRKQAKGQGYINSYPLDLSKKKSIQQFVLAVEMQFPTHIDVLINNAGLFRPQLEISEINIEMTLTVNHFGHFYLTYLLFDRIKKSKQARIINVSSIGHYYVNKKDNFYDDLQAKKTKFQHWQQYFLSKLANVHFTQALDTRIGKKYPNIKTVSVHPGRTYSTRLGDDVFWGGGGKMLKVVKFVGNIIMITQKEAAKAILNVCLMQFDKLRSGEYYSQKAYKDMDPKGRSMLQAQNLWRIGQRAYQIEFIV